MCSRMPLHIPGRCPPSPSSIQEKINKLIEAFKREQSVLPKDDTRTTEHVRR